MALNENDRAADQLLDDYLLVHKRLAKARKAANNGKQPKRMKPPVYAWRAEEHSDDLRKRLFGN